MTEEEVWACTPRKFFALLECGMEYNRAKAGNPIPKKSGQQDKPIEGYIDQIDNW